jgi:hypothetical protein
VLNLRGEGSTRVDTSRVCPYGFEVNLEPRLDFRERNGYTPWGL